MPPTLRKGTKRPRTRGRAKKSTPTMVPSSSGLDPGHPAPGQYNEDLAATLDQDQPEVICIDEDLSGSENTNHNKLEMKDINEDESDTIYVYENLSEAEDTNQAEWQATYSDKDLSGTNDKYQEQLETKNISEDQYETIVMDEDLSETEDVNKDMLKIKLPVINNVFSGADTAWRSVKREHSTEATQHKVENIGWPSAGPSAASMCNENEPGLLNAKTESMQSIDHCDTDNLGLVTLKTESEQCTQRGDINIDPIMKQERSDSDGVVRWKVNSSGVNSWSTLDADSQDAEMECETEDEATEAPEFFMCTLDDDDPNKSTMTSISNEKELMEALTKKHEAESACLGDSKRDIKLEAEDMGSFDTMMEDHKDKIDLARQKSLLSAEHPVTMKKGIKLLLDTCRTKRCNRLHCCECRKEFNDAIDFAKHFAHSACIYKIVCFLCLEYFSTAKDFQSHLMMDHDESFSCECGQSYDKTEFCRFYLHSRSCILGHPYLRVAHISVTLHPEMKRAVFEPAKVTWNMIEAESYQINFVVFRKSNTLAVKIAKKENFKVELNEQPPEDYECVLLDPSENLKSAEMQEALLEQVPWLNSLQDFVQSHLRIRGHKLLNVAKPFSEQLELCSSGSKRPHVCGSCGIESESLDAFRDHLANRLCIHPLICHICKVTFTKIVFFQHHMSSHEPFSCDCNSSYANYPLLLDHSLRCPHAHPITKYNSQAPVSKSESILWSSCSHIQSIMSSRDTKFVFRTFYDFSHQELKEEQAVVMLVLTEEAFEWKKRNRPPLSDIQMCELNFGGHVRLSMRDFVSANLMQFLPVYDTELEVMSLLEANQDCLSYACASCCFIFYSPDSFLEHLELGLCMHVFMCHVCHEVLVTREQFDEHIVQPPCALGVLECACSFHASSYLQLYTHSLTCPEAHGEVKGSMYGIPKPNTTLVTQELFITTKWNCLKMQALHVQANVFTLACKRVLLVLIASPLLHSLITRSQPEYFRHQMLLYDHPSLARILRLPRVYMKTPTSCIQWLFQDYREAEKKVPKHGPSVKKRMKRNTKQSAPKTKGKKQKREKIFQCLDGFKPGKGSKVICSSCKNSFSGLNTLKQHFTRGACHRHLECYSCKAHFPTLSVYLRHMAQHSTHICACGASFPNYSRMYNHSAACLKADRAAVMQDIKLGSSGAMHWKSAVISTDDFLDGTYFLSAEKIRTVPGEIWMLHVSVVV